MDPRAEVPEPREGCDSQYVRVFRISFFAPGVSVSAAPKPPPGLQKAGTSVWKTILRDVQEDWELDAKDLHSLEQAARAADRAQELEELIERDGLMIAGSTGQERLHPAIAEQRMLRQLSALLVSRIALEAPEPMTGHLSSRRRTDIRRAELRAVRGR